MRLTSLQINDAFIKPAELMEQFTTAWVLIGRANEEAGIELREALYIVRRQHDEIAVFVDRILDESHFDDVVFVIDQLCGEMSDPDFSGSVSLQMLHAWRARVMMQIVIDRRNSVIAADLAAVKATT